MTPAEAERLLEEKIKGAIENLEFIAKILIGPVSKQTIDPAAKEVLIACTHTTAEIMAVSEYSCAGTINGVIKGLETILIIGKQIKATRN